MKYIIEFELPDNETVKKQIKYCPVHWQIWGYRGDTIAKPKAENIYDTLQAERIKTFDYCGTCNHKRCDNCIANSLDDYCIPTGYAPKDISQMDSVIPKNALRSDCTGCRFVGMYDTQFPCANCVRKNKDYYDSE